MGKAGEIQGEGSYKIQNSSIPNACVPGYHLCKKEHVLQHRLLMGTLGGGPTTLSHASSAGRKQRIP